MESKILVLLLVIGTATAATWIGAPPKKPAHLVDKEGCYIKEINDVIPYGETITPIGYCYRIHCSGGMIDYASCGVIGTSDPKCHKTEVDLSKPYPDCCADIECDIENYIL